jgi:hypothetical protein
MKRILLAVIVTALLTWVAFSVIYSTRRAIEHFWLVSAIKAPGGIAIAEIQGDMNAGRYNLAKAKLQAFLDTWKRFEGGSDSFSGPGIGDIGVVFSKIDTNGPMNNAEPGGPAEGSQPVPSETNRTSSAPGSRR